MGRVLGRVAGRRAPDPALMTLRDAWDRAVGEQVARHAQPARLREGTLVVRCLSATWASELTLLQVELRRVLEAAVGTVAAPLKLRFEVGDLPPRTAHGRPAPDEPDADRLDRAGRLAAGIADEHLRAAVIAAAARSSVTGS